jgi:UDP-N-acetylglucosamine--N-acetylmuramyl-(pentapeptide) pyrophosphoryl-undecaprenol N-acetylglucosamine transferase
MRTRIALVMAGGTGGHIFPGIAVAEGLRDAGWTVHWIGAPDSMDSRLVPPRGFVFEPIAFSGVRGKGVLTLLLLPLRLLRAFWQSLQVVKRIKPDVAVGMGGYITFPAGLMAVLAWRALVLHEQNAVPGLANRILALVAERTFTAFPKVMRTGEWIGNPLRAAFTTQATPAERFLGRSGPLRVLVVGGSLGAKALNETVPRALALIPESERPIVTHQGGEKQIDNLRAAYAAAGVSADLTAFIDDTARAFADADVIICRAGASTVTEIAAIGAAAVFVPFPSAADDHQTVNARFLSDVDAAWLIPQRALSAESLAQLLRSLDRTTLGARAEKAYAQRRTGAVQAMVAACEELAK